MSGQESGTTVLHETIESFTGAPDGAEFDEYRDSEDNHIDILDEVDLDNLPSETVVDSHGVNADCIGCTNEGQKIELAMNERSPLG